MRINKSLIGLTAIVVSAFMALPAQAKISYTTDPKAVAAITQLENDAVKADLAGDASFYEKNFAENWIGGDSNGTWYTKEMLVATIKDTQKNKMHSEEISDLNVRTYGDTAIATYTNKYDMLFNGEKRAATILTTDTFTKQHGKWMQVSGHSSLMSDPATAMTSPSVGSSQPDPLKK
jgi:ketosteroid isomerase-like protein